MSKKNPTESDAKSDQTPVIGVAALQQKQARFQPSNDSQVMADDFKEEGTNDYAQAEEKIWMYVLDLVFLPFINATTVAPDLQVLEKAK